MKKRSTRLKWIGVTLASLGALASSGAMAHTHKAKSMRADSDGGLVVYSPTDSSYWFQLGGRLGFDETLFSGGYKDKQDDFPSGGNIRYARLQLAGGVGSYLNYNFGLNFNSLSQSDRDPLSASNGAAVSIENAWVAACSEYEGPINKASVRFGQYTPPTSIDNWGRYGVENDTFFLEPALGSATFMGPAKVLGLWADASAFDMFVLSASAHHPRQENRTNYGNTGRSDRLGGAARLTFAPVHTEDTVYHLGAIGRYQSMNNHDSSGNIVEQPSLFATAPEARARNTGKLVNVEDIRARSYNVVSGEALAMWGPAWIEGEYHHANVQRVPTLGDPLSVGNPEFNGWHVQAGYVLTGESRGYDFYSGILRNPKPVDKCGAWEILARYSYVNLVAKTKNIFGGSEHNTTVGLNWFVNENVRIAANYIRANIRPAVDLLTRDEVASNSTKRELDIFGIRFGVEF